MAKVFQSLFPTAVAAVASQLAILLHPALIATGLSAAVSGVLTFVIVVGGFAVLSLLILWLMFNWP